MELAQKARRVIVTTSHTTREGAPKILSRCTLPLTAPACVKTIITELAVIDVTTEGLALRELAAEASLGEVKEKTERAPYRARRGHPALLSNSPRLGNQAKGDEGKVFSMRMCGDQEDLVQKHQQKGAGRKPLPSHHSPVAHKLRARFISRGGATKRGCGHWHRRRAKPQNPGERNAPGRERHFLLTFCCRLDKK